MSEVFAEAVNGENYPVCVAAVSLLNGGIRVPDDGIFE
jgi:hypothetical protein